MGRKAEPGISYYRMNCGHTINKKVRLLFNEFGSDGYWIWQCLLDQTYPHKGYYFDCNDKDALELFATDVCKKQVSLVDEVIAGCVRRGLFDKAVFDMFGILSSAMIQEVYLDATKERRKKGTVIELEEKYLLIKIPENEVNISIIPGKNEIPPGKNKIDPGNNPQSKVENSKVEESKEENVAAAKPAPPQKPVKEKIPEPYWDLLVKTWFDFVSEKFHEPPLFAGEDPKFLKSIVAKLKKRAAAKSVTWNEVSAPERLEIFLKYAFSDEWLAKHFLLKTLDAKFEEIGRDKKQIAEKVKDQGSIDPVIEIQQLFEKYQQGRPNELLISENHFDYLLERKMVSISAEQRSAAIGKRMNGLTGSNQASDLKLLAAYEKNPIETSSKDPGFQKVVKRLAVMEFFYQLERQDVKKVFDEQAV
jgi:hypothetical protein